MPKSAKARPKTSTRNRERNILGVFLVENGRLPDFAQRRLDHLLVKNRTAEGLTPDEEREAREMVDYVEDKTIELLGYELAMRRARGRSRTPAAWRRHIDARLKQLTGR